MLSEDQCEAANQLIMVQNLLFLQLLVVYDMQSAPFPDSFFYEPMLTVTNILMERSLENTKAEINHEFSRLARVPFKLTASY